MPKYVMALDQGTTSSRAVLFDKRGAIVASAQKELPAIYPQPGWVEQDPHAILNTQLAAASEAIAGAGITPDDIAAIGITNQRETTILWSRETGEPVHNAIVWQCRRTARLCEDLSEGGWAEPVRSKTGLVIDPYFSATKVKWILENVSGARGRAESGEILFGNVDTWLIWNLTHGAVHTTDHSNASRTMLFNIRSLDWDDEILGELDIPRSMLPEVAPSSAIYGDTEEGALGARVPIAGSAGDQQAALFGQACFGQGMTKSTYGTGCFLLMNTGEAAVASENGLLTTIAWGVDERIDYALEGSVFIAGAAVQWLRDELGLIESAAESETLATSVGDTNGVYLVPAFVGLGAPYWDANARGAIVGLTRGARREHIVRAALESMAYQAADALRAMEEDLGTSLPELRVDGGAAVNDFLMQFQADILGVPVVRPEVTETTALGAAYLAGLAAGYWDGLAELEGNWRAERRFEPQMPDEQRESLTRGWHRAVERARDWVEG